MPSSPSRSRFSRATETADRSFLSWPFFETRHRELAEALDAWCAAHLHVDHADTDEACRTLVRDLGQAGWLRHSGAGEGETLDVRSLCLIRETLARHDGLADFAFAVASNWQNPGIVSLCSNINFLGVAKGSSLIAEAVCIKEGRTTSYYQIEVRDNLGNLVSAVTTTGYRKE